MDTISTITTSAGRGIELVNSQSVVYYSEISNNGGVGNMFDVTTLGDAKDVHKRELAELYAQRWHVELDLRNKSLEKLTQAFFLHGVPGIEEGAVPLVRGVNGFSGLALHGFLPLFFVKRGRGCHAGDQHQGQDEQCWGHM